MKARSQRYVALLRAVNVGGHNRVPMADWRALLQADGCHQVRTLLASGNAVFDAAARPSAEWAARIRASLAAAMAVDVLVIVKTGAEFEAALADNPLQAVATDPTRLFAAFASDAAALQALAPLAAKLQPPERLHIGRHAAWLWCPPGIHNSKAGAALMGPAGRATTARNAATVQKIADSLAAELH